MKLSWLAAVAQDVYYNGPVQSNDKKLDEDDFLIMAQMGNGQVMRDTYYEELKTGNNPILYFSGSIVTEYFKIEKKGRFRVLKFDEDAGPLRLSRGAGILRISPAMADLNDESREKDCETDLTDETFDSDFLRGEPGMESTIGSAEMLDDLGEAFYIPIGNTARLFGNETALYAEVDYIKNDAELDVPDDVAWKILNIILGQVLKVAGWPVDTTNNNNPNVTTVKQKLSDPAGF